MPLSTGDGLHHGYESREAAWGCCRVWEGLGAEQGRAVPSTPEPQALLPRHNPQFTVTYKLPSPKKNPKHHKTNKQTKLFAASKLIYTVLWRINPTTAQLSSFLGHHMLEKHFASTTTMGAWIICMSTRCISEKTVLDTFGTRYLEEKWDGREAVAMNSCCCRVGRLK